MEWTRKELIKAYINFFKSKAHKEIPNSSLIPEHDPTVLFTTAGMHPLVPFILGQKHPQGSRLVNVQKCIRTTDIEKVGDSSHLSFFEMLGNWSFGDYWKKETLSFSFEFLTKILKINPEALHVTCFAGDETAEKDEETAKIWQEIGIPKKSIYFLGKEDNWWGPAGKTGPCGPDTEIFVSGVEIWNDVFLQYNKTEKGIEPLEQKNVDTGMGVERTTMILNKLDDVYATETFLPIIKEIEKISKKKYDKNEKETKAMRIIADHVKAAIFILAEKIQPSNKEQGYVLRRLIRRAVRYGKFLMMQDNFTKKIAKIVLAIYDDYLHLRENKNFILEEIEKEESRFRQSLSAGLRYFEKIAEGRKLISGKDAFLLYQSYGFPIEMTEELASEKNMKIDMEGYQKELEKHQELSRTATKGRFKSGLADKSEETKKLHTATHLLLAALRRVLGEHVEQKGSNITPERLRLDFSHDKKLTNEQLRKIEEIVNKNISQALEVKREEMTLEQAKKAGALGVFEEKYGKLVSVYTIQKGKETVSIEICAGPHVKNTGELGKFKVIKEESVSQGIRRIKARLK